MLQHSARDVISVRIVMAAEMRYALFMYLDPVVAVRTTQEEVIAELARYGADTDDRSGDEVGE